MLHIRDWLLLIVFVYLADNFSYRRTEYKYEQKFQINSISYRCNEMYRERLRVNLVKATEKIARRETLYPAE